MVVFDTGENGGFRPIVEELGTTVEIGRVVLVALDDEAWTGSLVKAPTEIPRHSANQEPRIRLAGRVDPGGHRSCSGLAMGSGDDQRLTLAEKKAAQGLWHRDALNP